LFDLNDPEMLLLLGGVNSASSIVLLFQELPRQNAPREEKRFKIFE
jgi:hypothetical protein